MKARVFFFSLVVLMALSGFVFVSSFLALLKVNREQTVWLAIGVTVIFNFGIWILSPRFYDMILGWTTQIRELTWSEFSSLNPGIAQFIEFVCQKNSLPLPRIRWIEDQNPTAFCYGSGPWNARLAISEGLLTYLNEDEVKSVTAHELGHIANRDFIVMSIASTLLGILYSIYLFGRPSRGGANNKNPFAGVAAIAFLFYEIGVFLMLALSRSREYLADRFSAEATANPNLLSMALVKVAYGVSQISSAAGSTSHMLSMTRSLNIIDIRKVSGLGHSYGAISNEKKQAPLEKLFLFDLYNPWARLSELVSTHPLTGHRVQALNSYCQEFQRTPVLDLSSTNLERLLGPHGAIFAGFALDCLIYLSPFVLGTLALVIPLLVGHSILAMGAVPIAVGAGLIFQMMVAFPKDDGAEEVDVFDLMADPFASPLHGRYVKIKGKLIGRASAGSKFDANTVLSDFQGRMPLIYSGLWPWSAFFFGWRKVFRLIGKPVEACGWFFRGSTGSIKLDSFQVGGEMFQCHPLLGRAVGAGFLILLGLGALAVVS